jgi:pilus assembly protein Flp/PilA
MTLTSLKHFLRCDSGATAIEYGLIAALLGIGIIASLTNFRDGLNNVLVNVNDRYTTR